MSSDKVQGKTAEVDAKRGATDGTQGKEPWVKPEITSFKPVTAARGISYNRGDGLTNLTP